MLYILTALKPEAQAFVDKYKLKKTRCGDFSLFLGENIKVIISGVGVNNAKIATKALIENFNPNMDDIILNIGICGANEDYKLGELIEISSIIHKNNFYQLNQNRAQTVTCVYDEITTHMYEIVDMESFGFYEATKDITNRYMYKIVSDHFAPESVTKEKTKSLIFNTIEEIMKKVQE